MLLFPFRARTEKEKGVTELPFPAVNGWASEKGILGKVCVLCSASQCEAAPRPRLARNPGMVHARGNTSLAVHRGKCPHNALTDNHLRRTTSVSAAEKVLPYTPVE